MPDPFELWHDRQQHVFCNTPQHACDDELVFKYLARISYAREDLGHDQWYLLTDTSLAGIFEPVDLASDDLAVGFSSRGRWSSASSCCLAPSEHRLHSRSQFSHHWLQVSQRGLPGEVAVTPAGIPISMHANGETAGKSLPDGAAAGLGHIPVGIAFNVKVSNAIYMAAAPAQEDTKV